MIPFWVWVPILVLYIIFEVILFAKMLVFAFDPLMFLVVVFFFIIITAMEFIFLMLIGLILPHFVIMTCQPLPHFIRL
jgi:hypothetical protein